MLTGSTVLQSPGLVEHHGILAALPPRATIAKKPFCSSRPKFNTFQNRPLIIIRNSSACQEPLNCNVLHPPIGYGKKHFNTSPASRHESLSLHCLKPHSVAVGRELCYDTQSISKGQVSNCQGIGWKKEIPKCYSEGY